MGSSVQNPAERLVLGTVQLGVNYGIANNSGQPDISTAEQIVSAAYDGGVRVLDTAQGYGRSEEVLGQVLKSLGYDDFQIISKLHPRLDHLDESSLRASLERSLELLQVDFLGALLLHREDELVHWNNGLGEILESFRNEGLVKQLGVSVYSPEAAVQALKTDGVDIVQLPSNLLDRRFEEAGVYELAESKNKDVHIRSIYLQGLIFCEDSALTGNISHGKEVLKKLRTFCSELGLTLQEAAMAFVKMAYPQASVLFGAETPAQVEENILCWSKDFPEDLARRFQREFPDVDGVLLNPSLWKK
ncbi:MAG: aldo/keto reductase [Desulfovibrio sp.]